jgi:hypothetical protein
MSDWREDEVMNEARSRTKNEWIEAANDSLGDAHELDTYHCECSDGDCSSTVDLKRSEYEAVRADGRTFALMRDHEDPEFDRLVEERDRYSIVMKLPGLPARIALRSDPRAQKNN